MSRGDVGTSSQGPLEPPLAILVLLQHLPQNREDPGIFEEGRPARWKETGFMNDCVELIPHWVEQERNFHCVQSMRFRCLSVQQLVSP